MKIIEHNKQSKDIIEKTGQFKDVNLLKVANKKKYCKS